MTLTQSLLNATSLLLPLFCFIITLFSFFNLLKGIRRSHHSKLNLPPSPPKLPIIGNLLQIGTLPHRSFGSLSKKYGPIFFLNLGHTPTVVVSSPKLAYQIMKTHDLDFADRPQGIAARILLYGCIGVGFAPYGEIWKQKRKLCVTELLSLKRVQSFNTMREEAARDLVNKIREEEGVVNLSEVLVEATNMMLFKCVVGDEFSAEGNRRIGELARKVMLQLTAFNVGDYFPSLSWLGVLTGLNSKLKSLFKEFDEFFDEVVQERRMRLVNKDDHFSNNITKSLVDVILQLQQDGNLDSHFSQDDIKSILLDTFVAGTDTSSIVMVWVMTELMRNPMKMKRAQEEIRRTVGNKSKVDENDIDKMRYLKCVVKETLRLHPPVPLDPRLARSSVEVDGYTIPAKTLVYVNTWAIQRDSEVWENAEEFLPERFEKNEVDFKGQDMRFIPFGSGRRMCPGLSFGIAFVELMLANLLYRFDWKLPTNGNGVSVQHIDIAETFGLTVTKKQPLCLRPIPYSVQC